MSDHSPEPEPSAADRHQNSSILALAFSGPVVRRALIFAVVVGSVLVAINHSHCCFASQNVSGVCVFQVGLTVCVPYVVSTVSSVLALRQRCESYDSSK